MTLANVLSSIGEIITHLVGGTIGSGESATTITFANSWVGQFLDVITSNPLLLLTCILSFTLFGIHVMKSLMGR